MTKLTALTIALLIGAVPGATLAATEASSTVSGQTTTPVTTMIHRHHRSTVHHANGERFDVPSSLLRNRNTLINGLPPESAQFE